MYSALKHQGKKLYELARQGQAVERKARRITIYSDARGTDGEASHGGAGLELDVRCSKGTYIRTLAEDIGEYLGCGATVEALRRLEAGRFSIDDAVTVEELKAMSNEELASRLLAVDQPLQFMPAVALDDNQAVAVKLGQRPTIGGVVQGLVRMYSGPCFLGLGEMLLDGKLAPKKLFNLDGTLSPNEC